MHTKTRKTTERFARPFKLDGFEAVLPAGMYNSESENDVLDGMYRPGCLRPSVLIHMHGTPGNPGYSQSLTVPWAVLEAALLRDQNRATIALHEPALEGMLLDPIARQLMRSDGVSQAHIRDLFSNLSKRTPIHAKSDQ